MIRRLIPALALTAAAVACGTPARHGHGLPYYDDAAFTPRWAPVAHRIAAFRLTSQSKRAVTADDLHGRIHVASFIFTTCPNICPTLVEQLKRVEAATADVPDLLIVSYSVTPAIDTPDRLAAFGRERGIDPARWLLVTGDLAQIASLARRSYFADDARLDRAGGDAEVLHTEKLLLVDRDGRLRGVYNGTAPADVNRLIDDIRVLAARHDADAS